MVQLVFNKNECFPLKKCPSVIISAGTNKTNPIQLCRINTNNADFKYL